MNSRERVNLATQGKIPDRVPVWCLLSLEHIVNHGTSDSKIPRTIEDLVTAECNLARRYHFDGTLVYLPGTRRGTDISSLMNDMINSVPHRYADHVFSEIDPDSWSSEIPTYEPDDFFSSHLTREILGEEIHIGGWAADGFSRAIQWFPSLDEAVMATIEDSSRFKSLVNYFDQLSSAWAGGQITLGKMESIQISSPYAGDPFISIEAYKDLVLPSVRFLAAAIREAGGCSYLHTCGKIRDRIKLFAETGVDGIECMDPPPLGNVELVEAKQQIGSKLFLKGNIDSVNVLLRGDDQYVDDTIRHTIETGKAGGGYILSTACSVAPNVSPQRVRRMWELAEQYGQYD